MSFGASAILLFKFFSLWKLTYQYIIDGARRSIEYRCETGADVQQPLEQLQEMPGSCTGSCGFQCQRPAYYKWRVWQFRVCFQWAESWPHLADSHGKWSTQPPIGGWNVRRYEWVRGLFICGAKQMRQLSLCSFDWKFDSNSDEDTCSDAWNWGDWWV